MNTSFLVETGKHKNSDEKVYAYELNKKNVDPDSIAKSKDFDQDFKIYVFYKDACEECSPKNPIEDLC